MSSSEVTLQDPAIDLSVVTPSAPVETLRPAERSKLGPDYVRLWLATAVSNVGDGVRLTALPLLAATTTRQPLAIAGVMFAAKLPWLLFSLHAGAIVDRVDRRRLMVGTNIARALVMSSLALVLINGSHAIWALYAVALLLGIGEVFSDNASFALLPSVVAKDRLEDANGRLEAVVVVTNEFAGPALGGVLFAAAIASPFALDGVSFLLSAVLIASMSHGREIRLEPATSTTLRQEIAEGVNWLKGHRLLRDLSLIAAATNLVLHATFAIGVLFALDILKLDAAGFGLLLSAEAFGALAGSLMAVRLKERLGTTASISLSLGIAGLANLVVATSSSWLVVGAMAIAISFAGGSWNVLTNSLRQGQVPNRLLGRVQSAHRLLSWGAIPLGTLLGGLLATTLGLRSPFIVAGLSLCLLSVVVRKTLRTSSGQAGKDGGAIASEHA